MRWLQLLVLALALLSPFAVLSPPAWAVEPGEMLSDPVLEARARALSEELRCMVCQNESIDESSAPLAHDLRVLVRQRLKAGDSDQQVLDFLVARYGEFVLLKPRLSWHTAALWFGPPALLTGGVLILAMLVYRRRRRGLSDTSQPAGGSLTPAEKERLAQLTNPSDG
jgi:cytochrome c-type biogenesis protein CcmH